MKLMVQLPCFNEAETLPATLADLPRVVPGFDEVAWLVVDDGSTDGTAEVARRHGVDHVVRHARNHGLAHAFSTGIEACLALGADVIVNTDADNQYCAADLPALTELILSGKADMVIGTRPIDAMAHFSPLKRKLQRLGSSVVRLASGTSVEDAPSGFRAFSRRTAAQINVFSSYTYTLETIIQAGQSGLTVLSVPVRVNKPTRPSRLMRNLPSYVWHSSLAVGRIFVTYRPLRFFSFLGLLPFLVGFALGLRFLAHFLSGQGSGHIQSLILASLLMSMGFLLFILALMADLIAVNRKMLEKIDARLRQMEDRPRS